jgi:uncharacterized protein (DUF1330 family)
MWRMGRRRSTRSTCSISPTVRRYLACSRRSARGVAGHGGRVLALGRFRESAAGDIAPRQVLILVEWESRTAFESYRQDPELAGLHPHRETRHLGVRLASVRPA